MIFIINMTFHLLLHYFRIFSQPEKSTFFCGSTKIFTCCLLNDRLQSLTTLPSHSLFYIQNIRQINSTQQDKSLFTFIYFNGIIGSFIKIIWVREWLNFSCFAVLANDIYYKYHSLYHYYWLFIPFYIIFAFFPYLRNQLSFVVVQKSLLVAYLMIGHNHY
jgi:hypothetical protein